MLLSNMVLFKRSLSLEEYSQMPLSLFDAVTFSITELFVQTNSTPSTFFANIKSLTVIFVEFTIPT